MIFSSILRMTKTLSMASHNNYNLNARDVFVIFLTSKLFTCFIGGFTLKMNSQSIAYLLNENEHIYWILDLEDGVHSIWNLWRSGLQECKNARMQRFFWKMSRTDKTFQAGPENLDVLAERLPLPESTFPISS